MILYLNSKAKNQHEALQDAAIMTQHVAAHDKATSHKHPKYTPSLSIKVSKHKGNCSDWFFLYN
jgi:hypothetical protein